MSHIKFTLDNGKSSVFQFFQKISVQAESKYCPWHEMSARNVKIGMITWVGDFENPKDHGEIIKIEKTDGR